MPLLLDVKDVSADEGPHRSELTKDADGKSVNSLPIKQTRFRRFAVNSRDWCTENPEGAGPDASI